MSAAGADVALLTDRRYLAARAAADDWYLGNILADDGLLQAELAARGLTSVRVDWADPAVDWSAFRCAVFRTTWDYFERLDAFRTWLADVAGRTRLCNDRDTVTWNIDKHYLADLERRGVPVVPSRFVERGTTTPLGEVLARVDDSMRRALGFDQRRLFVAAGGGDSPRPHSAGHLDRRRADAA